MPKSEITIKIVETLLSVNENDWDACAESEEIDGSRPVDPFTTYRFLRALEDSGSVGNSSGWHPYYILAFRENELIGCAPMYIKHIRKANIFLIMHGQTLMSAPEENIILKFRWPFRLLQYQESAYSQKRKSRTGFPILMEGIKNFASKNKLSSAHITFVV